MKLLITVCVVIFGILGSWLGSTLDQGNMFGGWSILLGTIGTFVGIFIGYKLGSNLLG